MRSSSVQPLARSGNGALAGHCTTIAQRLRSRDASMHGDKWACRCILHGDKWACRDKKGTETIREYETDDACEFPNGHQRVYPTETHAASAGCPAKWLYTSIRSAPPACVDYALSPICIHRVCYSGALPISPRAEPQRTQALGQYLSIAVRLNRTSRPSPPLTPPCAVTRRVWPMVHGPLRLLLGDSTPTACGAGHGRPRRC